MNPKENQRLCKATHCAMREGVDTLGDIPGLIGKIIKTRAWESREARPGEIVELKSLRELVTLPFYRGWGEDPARVESLLKDDPEVLVLWREAMKGQGERIDLSDNIIEVTSQSDGCGTSKSYTLSRLERTEPELFRQVVDGDLSANAAAIQAGFRKKMIQVPDDLEKAVVKLLKRFTDNRIGILKSLVAALEPHEIIILKEWINE